jgi:Flp pilus assembly pilin Flp
MKTHYLRHRAHGQGLTEYALILAVVALVVIVIVGLVGLAVQRSYGVVGGALGTKYNAQGQHSIDIVTAQCIALQSANLTGLWVIGNTNEDIANLTGSTNQAVGTGMDGASSPVEANGPNGFKFHPLLSYTADLSICPISVVIQAGDGSIAVSPVTAEMRP